MIYDKIENAGRYMGQGEWLDLALRFMLETELDKLPIGRTEISGDKVFANVMEAKARDEGDARFEIHEKYMDIQIDIEGVEKILIGLDEEAEIEAYDEEGDFGTVRCSPAAECVIGPGRFIVCMKREPHKPGVAAQKDRCLKKCVIKVAVG